MCLIDSYATAKSEFTSENEVCSRRLLHIFANDSVEAKQCELQKQSDLDPHYLTKGLLKSFNRRQKQTIFECYWRITGK